MIQNIRKSIPWLLPLVVAILVIGLVLSRVIGTESDSVPPEPEIFISADEASNNIGAAAEVCGEVVSSDFLPRVNGEPTFLNFGDPYPNQVFTAVIFGDDRNQFVIPPEDAYINQEICVSGIIRMHDNDPQIVISNPEQVYHPGNEE